MFSWQSLGAWAVAGAIMYATTPSKAKELSKKEVDDENKARQTSLRFAFMHACAPPTYLSHPLCSHAEEAVIGAGYSRFPKARRRRTRSSERLGRRSSRKLCAFSIDRCRADAHSAYEPTQERADARRRRTCEGSAWKAHRSSRRAPCRSTPPPVCIHGAEARGRAIRAEWGQRPACEQLVGAAAQGCLLHAVLLRELVVSRSRAGHGHL